MKEQKQSENRRRRRRRRPKRQNRTKQNGARKRLSSESVEEQGRSPAGETEVLVYTYTRYKKTGHR